jgi:glycosidase
MEEQLVSTAISPITDEILESAVIYEANIRQYSAEGTFSAFAKDIPKLKELGVKIIWVMPIFPISKVKRKAKGDLFADDIEDEKERERYLGSYYAVSNFREVNPEFGTITDFRNLLKIAHENGMYVILDWVPNHTGWDHVWITEHPDFYTKNAQGEITEPLNEDGTPVGWADVADLNYENAHMQQAMIDDMLYWVKEEQIDGFRCDMAGMVPTSFWEKAIPILRAEREVFMLAESDKPELLKGDLFEMAYGWEVHHIMNAIAKGEKDVSHFDTYMKSAAEKWDSDDILMHFVTNHDENSWAGTIKERMGPAARAMTALTYCMPGMPLVYSGQEYDLEHRLKFFEKDSIPKKMGRSWALLKQLGELKNTLPALHGGKRSASYERLTTSDDTRVLAFRRKNQDTALIYIANLSSENVNTRIDLHGEMVNGMTGTTVALDPNKDIALAPWQYLILFE